MYEVSKQVEFSAAHQVRESGGACERVHGHNWRVVAAVRAAALDEVGMVIDFKDLKRALHAVVDPLDHVLLSEVAPFDERNPTSENLARYIFDELCQRLEDGRVVVQRVEVWETATSRACYERDGG